MPKELCNSVSLCFNIMKERKSETAFPPFLFRAETLLHHDRFSVHDVDALGGLSYALTIEVVNFMVHSLILHQCSANIVVS